MKLYLGTFLTVVTALLGLVLTSNAFLLGAASRSFIIDAYEWQLASQGVVQTGNLTRHYKYHFLHRHRDEVQTVVLGSSRSFGFRNFQNFPQPFYNLTSEANPPLCLVEETWHLLAELPKVQLVVFSVDMFQEFLHGFSACESPVVELLNGLPDSALQIPSQFDFPSLFSLSNARLSLGWVGHQLRSPEVRLTQLWQPQSYPCPNGEGEGRDYLLLYPGKCNGYRADGSNTYAYLRRESGVRLHRFLPPHQREFEFKTEVFEKLAEFTRDFRQRGGQVVAFFPPVVPGVVEQLKNLSSPSNFVVARDQFIAYLNGKGFRVFDATDSGRFGCVESEFIDDQHADASCYKKLMEHWPK